MVEWMLAKPTGECIINILIRGVKMEKAIYDYVLSTYAKHIKTDPEFIKLEKQKKQLIKHIEAKLSTDDDKKQLSELSDLINLQIFITGAGFVFAGLMDIIKAQTAEND